MPHATIRHGDSTLIIRPYQKVTGEDIWAKLRTMYDLAAIDDREEVKAQWYDNRYLTVWLSSFANCCSRTFSAKFANCVQVDFFCKLSFPVIFLQIVDLDDLFLGFDDARFSGNTVSTGGARVQPAQKRLFVFNQRKAERNSSWQVTH